MTKLDRIAVVQTAFIGDVLLTLPMMRALRAECPNAELTLVTTPAGAEIAKGVSWIDHVAVFDKRGEHRSTAAMRGFAAGLRPVDALLVPHKSFRTLRLVRMINAPCVITYDDAWTKWGATVRVPYPAPLHDADRHLELLRGLLPTATWTKEQCVPMVLSTEDDRVQALLHVRDLGPFVVVAPGTAWPTKQWPTIRMQEVATMIVNAGRRVVVLGDRSVRGCIQGPGIVDLCGRTTLRESAAIIAMATSIVCNDSAPLHLASLQSVPVVAVFGPTTTDFGFGPFGSRNAVVEQDLPCRPCSPHGTAACPLGTHACMTGIDADRVMREIEHLHHSVPASPFTS
ncbi:MAG: glycosyltransferase family 9 protein [Candidatus Kapabacteria bacterium]|nr:glycosyltransferase family 9 protein [Candidatus Kapabacteria bacterium]